MANHIKLERVCAGYGRKNVVSDISLSVARGESFGLIGLNGAGKTTLIKTMIGLKSPAAGDVTINGHRAGTKAAQKEIAFLPERFDPAWFLNAYEFVDFTLSLYGKKVSRDDIEEMAERIGFKREFLVRRAQAYSKGMRQKLGLMTTFMTDCSTILLDEPMSGLDPLARVEVKNIMMHARADGKTIFLSSHILSDMEELCDSVAVLHNGGIVFTGSPSSLVKETGQAHLERAFLAIVDKKAVAA